VALDLPARAREAIAGWRDHTLEGRGELRRVPARDLHVTLAFLGWTAADRVDEVWSAASAAAAGCGAPVFSPGVVVGIPPRRPRLLALDLADEDDRASALSRAVAGALSGAGLHEPGERAFWAHVTLARVRGKERAARPSGPPPVLRPFPAGVMALYRSDPSRSGARYTALERMELAGRRRTGPSHNRR
jgi:2'-5' RNA ligase